MPNGRRPRPIPPRSPSAREHLTYQMLLTREENPGPADKAESEKAAAERLAALRKEFAHPEDFQRALKDLGMTETEVAGAHRATRTHVAPDRSTPAPCRFPQ